MSHMRNRNGRILALGLLALTACAGLEPPDETGDVSSAVTVRTGVDYSWSPHPSPEYLHNAGYTFASRYLSNDPTKNLTASEATALRNAGVDVVSNWEASTGDAANGYARGVTVAQEAQRQAVADGMPAGRPIYFSVDFDPAPDEKAGVDAYFDGVASVLGTSRTGAYGGYNTIKHLFDTGRIRWGWQTTSWSGGKWDSRAQLRQVQHEVTIDGADCDIDKSQADDFGQWGAAHGSANVEKVVTARNANGTLETFWVGTGGAIQHAWQTSTGWSAASALEGSAKELAVGTNLDGRLELFYVGTNDTLYHRFQETTGGWSAEQSFGVTASDLAVGRNADGRLEVVYAAPDGTLSNLWQLAPNAGWSGTSALGGAAKDIAIGTNADGRLEVLYIGTNDVLYHRYQGLTGGWSAEQSFGVTASDLGVGRNADGRLELIYADPSGALNHIWQVAPNSGWTGSASLEGAAKKLVVGTNADGRLEVFYVGTNDALYHRAQLGDGWTSELAFGFGGSEVSVEQNTDGRLELIYAGTSGALSHTWQLAPNGGSGWSAGVPLAGTVGP